ncbi:uncharacterized protein F5147DRAFT_778921 [Suillus discolor]|uniref:Uncharacterized protein n=1 Tax=Suillus discolor TaxID=1912936 RepID=A0A9P7JP35_9AGAM|nr:uncharacterized protein F5147DRAFT_778921 [Suillus discolor]KAG2094613.1 hypothetical protein F5147DRAFT_778921 [Suillus discolor]
MSPVWKGDYFRVDRLIQESVPHSLLFPVLIPICTSYNDFCPSPTSLTPQLRNASVIAFITSVPGPSASSSSATGNSTNTNNSTGSPNPSVSQMTHDQIVAENLRQVADNAIPQQRRDAGEPNIPTDELLIPTPPQPTGTALQQWIAAFTQLSPNSQNQGSAILTPKTVTQPNITSVLKVLFDSSKEAPSGASLDSTYNFGIHSFIQDLLVAGQYCPLTLFTNINTEHLHRCRTWSPCGLIEVYFPMHVEC